MKGIGLEFEWVRFPDYRVERIPGTPGSLLSEVSTELLVARGPAEAALRTRPLDKWPNLYLELAKAEPTTAGHLKFAKAYGLLTDPQRDYLYDWPKLVEKMRNLVAMAADRENWAVQDGRYAPYDLPMKFALRFGPAGEAGSGMALTIRPDNLYQALVLQCVSNSAAGGEIRSCKACGDTFEIGGSSGRRSNREFCSDKCRFEFSHRSRRRKQ